MITVNLHVIRFVMHVILVKGVKAVIVAIQHVTQLAILVKVAPDARGVIHAKVVLDVKDVFLVNPVTLVKVDAMDVLVVMALVVVVMGVMALIIVMVKTVVHVMYANQQISKWRK